jgi:hypothetical protein
MDDYEDGIGQALVNVARKDILIVEQVGGVGDAGRVRLHGALALVGLIHVTFLGCIIDLDMTTNGLSSTTKKINKCDRNASVIAYCHNRRDCTRWQWFEGW